MKHLKIVLPMMLLLIGVSLRAETHYLDVGETLTLYLPSSVTNLALKGCIWTSSRPDDVEILSQSTFSCKIKANNTFTSNYPAIIHCEYYYYQNYGGYTYLRTGYVDYNIYVNEVLPTSISMRSSLSLDVGDGVTLTPTIYPTNAVTTLTWSSSDYSVVSVSSSGYIKACGSGTARITVMTSNGLTASCLVSVHDVYATGISLTEKETLIVGESKKLSYKIIPSNSNSSVTWSSDNPSIVSVEQNGTILAKMAGMAIITVATDNGYSASCVVTVPPLPESIILPESITIGLYTTKNIEYSFYPKDAMVSSVVWRSDNIDVATVDQSGNVTAVGVGNAIIEAETSNGCKSICEVTVPEPVYAFYVWTVGGEKVGYPLEERPTVVYNGEKIVLTTTRVIIEYPAESVRKYTLEDMMSPPEDTHVDVVEKTAVTMRQIGDVVVISGCNFGSQVMVYSLNGVLLQLHFADVEGNVEFSMADYAQGIYIIKTETITYKIIKR